MDFRGSVIYLQGVILHKTSYTLFAIRNEPKPVLRYASIRTRLSTYLNANYGHFKISFFPKRQNNFREQWFVPSCEQGIET